MLTDLGPKVLEYNVRFGDPETEALILLLSEDTDLAEIVLVRVLFCHSCNRVLTLVKACVERRLDSVTISTRPGSAVSVVLASSGYPGTFEKGKIITIGEVPPSMSTRAW